MKRPRVVRVYKGVKAGGGVHSRLLELLPRLAEHLDIRVLCYRVRGERAGELEAIGVAVDLIPMGSKWAPWNVRRYEKYFRFHRPDVVHTHEYTANTLAIAAAARAGVPVRVRHLHAMAPWGWGGRLRTALRVLADRRAARAAHVTLAVSEAVRQCYLDRTGLPHDSCRVLYNGIGLGPFRGCRAERGAARERWGIPADAPVVGVVGRLSRGKGHEEFLSAARILAGRVPRARFLIVGDGGSRPALEALCRSLGLSERVVFTGYRSDVPALLGAMDVFLFPSAPDKAGRIQDGLPGAVIEAQAAGLPVVAFRLPMMKEVLEEGASGVLVPIGDAEGAAEACARYLLDPPLAEGAVRAAVRAASRFSLDVCVERTLGLYEELLSRHGRSK